MDYALITGASRGIGRAVALALAANGHNIIINYRSNDDAANEVAASVEAMGVKASLMRCDVSNPEAVETALEEWEQAHPEDNITVLVNNAGIRRDNLLPFISDEDWQTVLDTTLVAFFHLTRRLIPRMMRRRNGRIVNIASLSGLKGMAGQVNYSAAKGALIAATKALAQEVAPRGVTVNAVAPGFIATDMTAELPEEQLKAMIPMRRFGRPEEVASAVAFLASPQASYITAEVININGGLYS